MVLWMPDWLSGGEEWVGVYEEQTRSEVRNPLLSFTGQGQGAELRRQVDIFLTPRLPPPLIPWQAGVYSPWAS